MRVEMPFGETTIEAELPDDTFVIPAGGVTKQFEPIEDLPGAVDAALANPLDSKPIRDLVGPGSKVTIAFDDPTAPCFSPLRGTAIKAVLAELEAAGVAQDSVTLICANALHRKFRHDELATIIGDDLVNEFGARLVCHDAEDANNLVYLGKTKNGYDVEVNRLVTDSDLVVYITSYHGRGFSGGWKSVCVGLSTWRSIRHHHTPDGMSMSIQNNHMHKMLDEMGAHLESKIDTPIFKIDAVEVNAFQTSKIFAGSVWGCRKAVLEILEKQFPPRRDLSKDKYDVVVYGLPDWSPYAIFSHMNPTLTLISSGLGYLGGTIQALGKPGCTVIMATPCPERWDQVHHPSYQDVWENVLSQCLDPYEIEREYTDTYISNEAYIDKYRNHFGFHPVHGILATHPLRRLKHAGKVIVAGIEDPAIAKHLGYEATATVEAALDMAAEIHGAGFSCTYAQHPATYTKTTM